MAHSQSELCGCHKPVLNRTRIDCPRCDEEAVVYEWPGGGIDIHCTECSYVLHR